MARGTQGLSSGISHCARNRLKTRSQRAASFLLQSLVALTLFACSGSSHTSQPLPSAAPAKLASILTDSKKSDPLCSGPAVNPEIKHVFIIVLENKSFENTFSDKSQSKLKELAAQGLLLTNYWGIAHNSLPNYIAMVSGQAPNPVTQMDCPVFLDFIDAGKTDKIVNVGSALLGDAKIAQLVKETRSSRKDLQNSHNQLAADGCAYPEEDYGQLAGAGCVYPKGVCTIADQLGDQEWRAYMQDMKGKKKDNCVHPEPGHIDRTAIPFLGKSSSYTPRHNPFVYFHSLIGEGDAGQGSCAQNDRPLGDLTTARKGLAQDLDKVDFPKFVFISPSLCYDGHNDCIHPKEKDGPRKRADEIAAIDSFVPQLVQLIMRSPVYKDSMIVVTFDEAEVPRGFYYSPKDEDSDDAVNPAPDWADRCCDEQPAPMWKNPGIRGLGGGKVGAIVLSPFLNKKTLQNNHEFNHYALLRTIEDLFHLKQHLGFAGQDGLNTFQKCDVFDPSFAVSASSESNPDVPPSNSAGAVH